MSFSTFCGIVPRCLRHESSWPLQITGRIVTSLKILIHPVDLCFPVLETCDQFELCITKRPNKLGLVSFIERHHRSELNH